MVRIPVGKYRLNPEILTHSFIFLTCLPLRYLTIFCMNIRLKIRILLLVCPLLWNACQSRKTSPSETTGASPEADSWMLGPFSKIHEANPCLLPEPATTFNCPVRRETVRWEVKDVFNPAAVVRNGQVYLLYRAEDSVGRHAGTSRIGLATSTDGRTFERRPQPVFYPDNDAMKIYEWEGGCEDPRVVEDENGRYFMTYTAYDGQTARLLVASSADLESWQKHGPVFGKVQNGRYVDLWSKSGSIVCRREGDRLVATRLNGKYWMYWGDTQMYVATSDNLIDWEPLTRENGEMLAAFGPRPGMFDSRLVEPGPPALLTEAGIVLIYNSMNLDEGGDPDLPAGTYTAGQVLLDPDDPTRVSKRTDTYFMRPEQDYEITGQVGNVVFLEGLVHYKGEWFLYYGTADSKIAVAVSPDSQQRVTGQN
jgi:beta-1,2-mannosidase